MYYSSLYWPRHYMEVSDYPNVSTLSAAQDSRVPKQYKAG